MSKELDEFYKKYSARIITVDDTPVKVMNGGKFKLLSIEEYEQMITKIADLEAKLAEKEKENLKLKGVVDSFDKLKQYHKDAKQLIFLNPDNVYADGHKLVIEKDNQDKISFAVEQLSQAKEFIKEKLEYIWNNNAEMTCRDRNIIDGIYTKIDEQIEELTHQHEDKGE